MRRFPWRPPTDHSVSAGGLCLLAEAEALLTGHYEQYEQPHPEPVPAWSRINMLAHGDVEAIRRVGSSTPVSVGAPREADRLWLDLQRIIALDLLALADDEPLLVAHLQRAVLVPLELQLMEAPSNELRAAHVLQVTRAAMRVFRNPRLSS